MAKRREGYGDPSTLLNFWSKQKANGRLDGNCFTIWDTRLSFCRANLKFGKGSLRERSIRLFKLGNRNDNYRYLV